MTEKITINGEDVWLIIDPQDAQHGNPNIIPAEYFIARYCLQDPEVYIGAHAPASISDNLFRAENEEPKRFLSPVEAIEYAIETLPAMLSKA